VLTRTLSKRDRAKKKKGKIKWLCQVFGISRQALHKRKQKTEKRCNDRVTILNLIKPIRKRMPRVGATKLYDLIKNDLNNNNIKMGRDKFFNFLRHENLLVKKKKNFTKTTNSFHRFRKHKNLIKDLDVNTPEQVWVSDITYIKTEQGHKYLSLITDYYSKKIVGYNLADNLKTESTLKALKMALKSRIYPTRELIHHSDRGFQYCSDTYIETLAKNNIKPSMTEAYDPYENAVAERVNGILKDEFDIGEGFINQNQAAKEIKYAIQTYNTFRPHLSCEKLTPEKAHEIGTYKLKKWGKKKGKSAKKD
jgi:putative transposase